MNRSLPHFRILSILLFCGMLISAHSQQVSTFHNDPLQRVDDALIFDNQGNLFGSHFMGNTVYKITPSGVCAPFATGFNTPNGLAFDSQNNLYVCDLSGNRIYKLSETGIFLDTIHVPTPSGIIKSQFSDTLIFTQYTGNKISKLAPDGTISVMHSGSPMNGSVGLAYDDEGQLYVANFTDRQIFKVNESELNYVATVPSPSSGALGFIAFAQGTLWATSYNGHKIYRVYPNFTDSILLYSGSTAGSTDGPIETAHFNLPNGITSSVTGDSLFVSDFGTGRVRTISLLEPAGIIENAPNKTEIIFPNPANDYITLSPEAVYDRIEISDPSGELVLKSYDSKIFVGGLSSGIYIVEIYNGADRLVTRFIKH